MQSRLLRFATLAGLSALAACTQDPKTHAAFNVTPTGGGGSGVDGNRRGDGERDVGLGILGARAQRRQGGERCEAEKS